MNAFFDTPYLIGVRGRYACVCASKSVGSSTNAYRYIMFDIFSNKRTCKPNEFSSTIAPLKNSSMTFNGSTYFVVVATVYSGSTRNDYLYFYTINPFVVTYEIPLLNPGSKITLDKAAEFNGIAISANTEYTTTEAGVLALTTTDVSGTIEEPTEDIILTNDSI